MLAVYTVKGNTLNQANLVRVAGNEDDPSGGVTSRVDFQANLGTTYYIQVGSVLDTNDNQPGLPFFELGAESGRGRVWVFDRNFPMSSMENYIPDDSSNSVAPSLFGLPPGSANARITVSRTGGNVGRCEVTLNVLPGNYTNFYATNFLITNIYITNFSSSNITKALSYTNIFMTNIASVNNFADFAYPSFSSVEYPFVGYFFPNIMYDAVDSDIQIVATNANGMELGPFTNNVDGFGSTAFGAPEFFTNFPCNLGTTTTMVSNSDVVTETTTEVICGPPLVTIEVVPGAWANAQFTPISTNLVFDDYQMSQDVYVQIYPILDPNSPFGERPNNEAVEDFYTAGPEDFGFALDPNYTYYALSSIVQLSLTNLALDPQEDPDIVPPTLTTLSNAYIDIQNYWDAPFPFDNEFFGNGLILGYTNDLALFYDVINFERYTYRCDKNCGTASVFVQRSQRGVDASHTIHYTIDSKVPTITVIDDNAFATVADADYANPYSGNTNQTDYDFKLPVMGSQGWNGLYGLLTFPGNSIAPEGIYIPITNNGAVEFDEDIEIELFYLPPAPGEANADATIKAPGIPAVLGLINTARLTINFDDIVTNTLQQPGGAVDRLYNVDGQADSYPPENPVPGANSVVNAVAIQPFDGMAVIGGDFDAFNTTSINYLARLQTNGLMDATFTSGLGSGPNNFVNAIVIDGSNRIIIGGNFTSVNGVNASYIARINFDGTLDKTFVTGLGFNSFVYALAIDANGNILVGGDFTSFNTTNCNHIARLLPSGGLDTTFLPSSGVGATNGTDQDVMAVATDFSGKVIIGGNFSVVNGTNWSHIGRLLNNGNLDTSFNPGLGADGNVLALAIQPDNSIIMGGAFHNFNLLSRNSIARLTPFGALDATFAPGSGFDDIVYSLVLQPDNNILVGGQFTMYNGTRRIAMARLLGDSGWLDTSFMDTSYNQFAGLINHYYNTNAYNPNDYPPGNSRNQVLGMGLQNDGNIVIGGSFVRVGGGFTRVDVHTHQNVARVIGPATPGPNPGGLGLGNYPGNVGLTQSPYTVDDTGSFLFVTLDRINGSLGPATLTLSTNTLPPSSSSATDADFGLQTAVATYSTVYDIAPQGAGGYGWRMSDGEYGLNNNVETIPDGGASDLFLSIKNDPSAAPILYADLNLLNLNANNQVFLGGVPIPFGPALAQYTSQLNIINDNFPAGMIGFSATNYNVLESGGTVTLTLYRTNGNYGRTSVNVNTKNGTAIEGTSPLNADYTFTSQPVVFQNGVTSNSVQITILDHSTQQSNKFFNVYLSSPTGGATLDTNIPPLLPSNTIVTIVDDHFQPGYLSFSSPTYSVLKPGLATISVSRSGAALGQLSVEVGTSNGTALNNVNYVGVTNTLSWNSRTFQPRHSRCRRCKTTRWKGPKTVNLFLFNPKWRAIASNETNAQVLTSPSNAVLTIHRHRFQRHF
jgi:uncharacterized delta-60 repeat protein